MKKYLIRLDDACPTMDAGRWLKMEMLLDQYGIRPMVGIIPANAVIEIEYTMGKYDPKKSCQVVIQPTSDKAADYGKQNYPILWNNFEPDNPPVLTVDCDRLLTSSVKKNLIGFRICNNDGSYEKYKWQSDWGFTITKVTLKPKK